MEWVTNTEQGNSCVRIAIFSLWTGRRNQRWLLKRFTDAWDRNESTSDPNPCQLDYYYYYYYYCFFAQVYMLLCLSSVCVCVCVSMYVYIVLHYIILYCIAVPCIYYIQIDPYRLNTTIGCRICQININVLNFIMLVCKTYK